MYQIDSTTLTMDKQTEIELLNIVAFAILMENDKGILNKSPDYIMEKFQRYCQGQGIQYDWGLDLDNQSKLIKWIKRWMKNKTIDRPLK